ncbi:MAG: hypothetical protein ABL888_20620 [Pirellulaceae bacterium]
MEKYLTLLVLGLLSVACTRETASVSKVKIRFPSAALIQKTDLLSAFERAVRPLSESGFDSTPPTDLSEIECFAVFVGADEQGMNESTCKNDSGVDFMSFGPAAGLFSTSESGVLDIKSGAQRRIYVAGLKKLSGYCEGPNPKDLTPSNYSFPYLLAVTVQDLTPGEVTIDMVLENSFSGSNKMADCTFTQPPPSSTGPSPSPTPLGIQMMVASAYRHTCALSSTGVVKCWGQNNAGQLGQGDINNRGDGIGEMGGSLNPVDLDGVAVQIGVGAYHSCALMADNTIKCWGDNFYGQLGREDTIVRGDGPGEMGANLVSVDLGTGRSALQLAVGSYTTCALLDNFTAKCWGKNDYGQLGYGDTVQRGDNSSEMGDNLPIINFGGVTPIKLFAGVGNTCAILATGALKCWGDGANGALGNGVPGVPAYAPTQVTGLTSNVVDVEIGYGHSCAVMTSGAVNCWGMNFYGGVGDGTTTDRSTPVPVLGISTAVKIGLGNDSSCAILSDGTLKCWGANGNGTLGIDSTADQSSPATVLNVLNVSSVTSGMSHTCAVASGLFKCWGMNGSGELGLGDTTTRGHVPSSMSSLPNVDLAF